MNAIIGQPNLIKTKKIGRIVKNRRIVLAKNEILLTEHAPLFMHGDTAAVIPKDANVRDTIPSLKIEAHDYTGLHEGDIVSIDPDGMMRVLWQESSDDNVLFITDFCNSKCIMCPQVPDGTPYSFYAQCEEILSLVRPNETSRKIGITGGEPTLFQDEIVSILEKCRQKMPNAEIAMLTNGKNFDDFDFAKKCAMANRNVTYCVPLYAPFSDLHDTIVGSAGSFQRTMNGIYNLIRLKCMVEIRIVVLRQNYQYLPLLMDYIFQNLPFVVHVAIMGMETTGLAKEHLEDIWIDPVDYQEQLRTAVLKLRRCNLNFSIYNLPRCLLPREVWGYDRDSISAWKKTYLPCCEQCCERSHCCGLFSTSIVQSSNIRAFINETKDM